MRTSFPLSLLLSTLLCVPVKCRLHSLRVLHDTRSFFPITTFGFYSGGFLAVDIANFRLDDINEFVGSSDSDLNIGFSIDRTSNDAINPFYETSKDECILARDATRGGVGGVDQRNAILTFVFDLEHKQLVASCSSSLQSITILKDRSKLRQIIEHDAKSSPLSNAAIFGHQMKSSNSEERDNRSRMKREMVNDTLALEGNEDRNETNRARDDGNEEVDVSNTHQTPVKTTTVLSGSHCEGITIPLLSDNNNSSSSSYNATFILYIGSEHEEGLYSLYFHNCHNYQRGVIPGRVSFDIKIEERNNNSFLSAGEMPLPALYTLMASLFFLSGCAWLYILRKKGRENCYRIHALMAVLVFLKSLSLLFHGVNYSKLATHGIHIQSWAFLYYITHLLKGALLFFTLALIGSGWAFVKHVLSPNEKRVFAVVLPLQVLANVAYIILEESEEGDASHAWWMSLFMLVDLVCCGAILLPVVWSIRHLQAACGTDGKASLSLERLKLFRHFYIMVVCYIYFTRIVVYLLKITVAFQYEWLDEMFKEMTTFVFFVITGYKFRPASNNPYFKLPTDDYEVEEVLIGSTGINERVTSRRSGGSSRSKPVFFDDSDSDDTEGLIYIHDDQENDEKPLVHESSHDLD